MELTSLLMSSPTISISHRLFSMQISKFQRRSCNLSFLFPPRRQSARRACWQAKIKREQTSKCQHPVHGPACIHGNSVKKGPHSLTLGSRGYFFLIDTVRTVYFILGILRTDLWSQGTIAYSRHLNSGGAVQKMKYKRRIPLLPHRLLALRFPILKLNTSNRLRHPVIIQTPSNADTLFKIP